ncbi:MAG: chloride channel protein [Cyanobacteria bacterium J06638_7]
MPFALSDLLNLGRVLLLGVLVGVACWPLNQVDMLQDRLLGLLPAVGGEAWNLTSLLFALAPLPVMPLLLWLQQGPWAAGAGSGIPQTMDALGSPEGARRQLGPRPTAARLGLWTIASLALFPLGREGPVVQLGASVAAALQRRLPRLAPCFEPELVLAMGAGAGLAGGFNSPLMGALFVMEELTRRFLPRILWPSLLVCVAAAMVSNLGGIPLFPLGMVSTDAPEWRQLLWALLVGSLTGLLGGLFSRTLLAVRDALRPWLVRRPVALGLALGAALALMAVLSGGWSGGDGEVLMQRLLERQGPLPAEPSARAIVDWLLLLLSRVLAPVLALAAGVPGGLIDPSLTVGALFGGGVLHMLGGETALGVALGMAGALAGATQLPLTTAVFAIKLGGDQQWLLGIVLSAALGAEVGRRLQAEPVYHALRGPRGGRRE